jgi:hypothetical protein
VSEEVGKEASKKSAAKLGNKVSDAKISRELAGISSKHESQGDGRVEVSA